MEGDLHAQAAQQWQLLTEVADEAGPLLWPEQVCAERGASARLHEELQLQGARPARPHRHFSICAAPGRDIRFCCVRAHRVRI